MQKKHSSSAVKTRQPLRVVMVEDSPADVTIIIRALEKAGFEPTHKRVDCAESFQETLAGGEWDLILADHSMPGFSAPEALAIVKNLGLDLPFIIVSGHIEEETAVEAMMAGAHDYVMKDRLARLGPAIVRELNEASVRRARRESETALRYAQDQLEERVKQRTAALEAANRKLAAVLEERKRLEAELLEIAENERRRIGFDLHDDLGQRLTGICMMVGGLEQKLRSSKHPAAKEARQIKDNLEETLSHTHNLARNISDIEGTAEGHDLEQMLKKLVERFLKLPNLKCKLSVAAQLPSLPAHTCQQLYKITQEAVNNAIKHGKATQVSIHVAPQEQELLLTVENDGVPFSPPSAARHRMGLRIMRYRASTIEGVLEIKPRPENGTLLTCRVRCGSENRPEDPKFSRQGSLSTAATLPHARP